MRKSRTSNHRKLSIYGFEMVTGGHNFYALLDFDITNLRKHLRDRRREGTGGSLFALILKAIGRCLHEFPEFNSMINLRTTSHFDEVDINIPVEIELGGRLQHRQYIIRDIEKKSLAEVDREIHHAKTTLSDQTPSQLMRAGQFLMGILPKWLVLFVFKLILSNHKLVQDLSGTVFVTSVSMFTNVPGYIIPYIAGLKAASFAVGSVNRKPVVAGNEIHIREMINITSIFNHDAIDGAPAARFINRLREYLEQSYDALM